MQVKFASLFDDAPQIPYSEVLSVFASEFGRPPSGPGGMFEYFDEHAVASASIAQVHKARMWPGPGETEGEGQWVAVKVRGLHFFRLKDSQDPPRYKSQQ
jgi:aarF domain-containing kinase